MAFDMIDDGELRKAFQEIVDCHEDVVLGVEGCLGQSKAEGEQFLGFRDQS